MAVSYRELYLMVRASNQASSALRRVAADVRGLSAISGLKQQRAQLGINRQSILTQRQMIANELASIASGRRRAVMDKANLSHKIAENHAQMKANTTSQQALRLAEQLTTNKVRQNQLNRALTRARGAPEVDLGKIGDLRAQLRAAQIAQDRLLTSARNLPGGLKNVSMAMTKNAVEAQRLAGAEADLAHRSDVLGQRMATSTQRLALNAQKMRDVDKAINTARWDRLGAAGRTIQHMGRVVAYGGLVMGASLAYAANSAAQFETQAQLVGTQMGRIGISAEQSAKLAHQLGAEIIRIMPESTASVEELTNSAYNLFSSLDSTGKSFLTMADGVKMLKLTSQAAIAGQTDIETATEGVVGVMSNFKIAVEDMPKTMNRLFAAVRFGRMTFGQFSETLATTAPAANQAGQSLDTLAGTMAFLSRSLGPNKAAVGFARLNEIFTQKKFVEGFKKVGIEIVGTNGRFVQMDEMMRRIIKRFPQVTQKGTKELAGFFKMIGNQSGTIQARRAFQAMATDMETYQSVLRRVKNDNREFTKSLKAMEETTGIRWQKMVNQFKAFALMIGAAVIPVLLQLQPYIQKMIDWWKSLDAATRDQYVRWAAIAAGLMLVGSAVAFVSGLLIRLFTVLGSRIGMLPALALAFVAISTAVGALTGDFRGLNGAIDRFVSFGTGSIKGWVVMLGLAAIAALKMRKAILGMSLAWTAGSAGTASGGMISGIAAASVATRKMTGDFKIWKSLYREQGSGRMAANLGAAAATLGGMTGSIATIGIGIAAVAAGALIWKRHMQNVREEAQRIKNLDLQVTAPQRAATRFAGIADSVIAFREQKVAVERLNQQIAQYDKQLKSATGTQRREIELARSSALVDRARAVASLSTSYNNLRVSAGAFNDFLKRQQIAQIRVGETMTRLNTLAAEYARLESTPSRTAGEAAQRRQRMAELRSEMEKNLKTLTRWKAELAKGTPIAFGGFNKLVTTFQQLRMLPAGIGPQMRRMAFDFQKQLGHLMSPAQMKKFFTFALNINTAPANNAMAQFIRKWRAKKIELEAKAKLKAGKRLTQQEILGLGRGPLKPVEIQPEIKKLKTTNLRKIIAAGTKGLQAPVVAKPTKMGAAKKTLTNAFKTPIKQKIEVDIPNAGELSALGGSISAGIQAGLKPITQDVVKRITQDPFTVGNEIKSPSRWMAREVGKPISEGIRLGILQDIPEMEKTAALQATLFAGAWIQALEQKMQDGYDPLKAAELQAKADKARIKAAKKGATELDRVRSQQAQKAAQLARKVTVKDLIKDTQGQAKAFEQFNRAIGRLGSRGVPKALLDDLRELGVEGLRYILLLSNATPKELRKFVNAWKRMEKEIKKSTYSSQDAIKQWKDDVKKNMAEAARSAGERLADMWMEFRDQAAGQFGDLFSNIDPSTYGQGYIDAMESWRGQITDLENQMQDLYKELGDLYDERAKLIADYNKEVADIKAAYIEQQVERLKSAFGELFAGEYLSARKEWAAALSFSDLQRDLDEQLKKFTDWRTALAAVAARGVPQAFVNQLEQLGPEALGMIQLLASGTDEELSKYMASWTEAQTMFQTIAEQNAATSSELAAQLAEALGRFSEAMQNMSARMGDVLGKINDVAKEMRKVLAEMPKQMSAADIVAGVQAQIDKWMEYQGVLASLAAKGVPLELIEQLRNLGPDALPFLQKLNELTSQQLLEPGGFVDKWKTAQKLIDDATHTHMQQQLAIWYQYGFDIASQLIAGVASQSDALIGFFSNLFMSLLQGYMPTYNPPVNTGPGGGGGTTVGGTGGIGAPDPWFHGNTGGTISTFSTGSGSSVNMTVNAVQDQSLMSTIETASFRLGTRNIE